MIRHMNAAAAFQGRMHERPIGMLAIRVVRSARLETDGQSRAGDRRLDSLGLFLDRTQSIQQLTERTTWLQQTNQKLAEKTLAQPTEAQEPEQPGKYLRVIQDAATYMNTMIGAMLTLSKTGRVDLHRQSVEWPTGGLTSLLGNTVKDSQGRYPLHVQV